MSKEDLSVVIVTGQKIEICNVSGTVKKSLSFSLEVEGVPQNIDIGGNILVCSTSKEMLKLWNI